MSALRPLVDDRARAAIDSIGLPIAVTTAVRDRDGRLLDFRFAGVNLAAAAWAGLDRAAMLGRLATDLLPGLRPMGLFDELEQVVRTGKPFRQTGRYVGIVEAGRPFDGTYDLLALRHGDGYLGAWAERDDAGTPVDLDIALGRVRDAVPLIRLKASATPLRLSPAT
ncbi:MAG TPA: PAS domain-containing protein [Candidatus Binatus sp.]|nr:PAS domain-containing protein [Candidatus Binatus sp.]